MGPCTETVNTALIVALQFLKCAAAYRLVPQAPSARMLTAVIQETRTGQQRHCSGHLNTTSCNAPREDLYTLDGLAFPFLPTTRAPLLLRLWLCSLVVGVPLDFLDHSLCRFRNVCVSLTKSQSKSRGFLCLGSI